MAHRLPPGSPPGASYACPADGCNHTITKESEAEDILAAAALDDKKLSARDLIHRNQHAGQRWLKLKLLWVDHVKRCPSLLHLILNSTGSTLIVALKAGATEAEVIALNKVLADHHCHYRFKLNKKARDAKATGNECRKMMWTPGLLLKLVDARWGKATSPADRAANRELAAAQSAGEHLLNDDDIPPPPPPAVQAPPPAAPSVQDTIRPTYDFAALLAASAAASAPTPTPTTAPTTAPADDTISDDADDADGDADGDAAAAGIEEEEDSIEAVDGDIVGTRATAVTAFNTLMKLQMELNTPWPNSERKPRAAAAQKMGAAWATSLRAHSNNGVGHYYMHLCYAHLEELIVEHDHLAPAARQRRSAGEGQSRHEALPRHDLLGRRQQQGGAGERRRSDALQASPRGIRRR
jgi:hypothetical protein